MATKTKAYKLSFANGTFIYINNPNLLQAQKRGHEEARRRKTFLISAIESELQTNKK